MNKKGQIMPMPIFIPRGEEEVKKCPKCKKGEDIKEVCKHCGYVYKESKESYPLWWLCILIDVGILFGACFLFFGTLDLGIEGNIPFWVAVPYILIVISLSFFLGVKVWDWLSKEKKDDK